MRPMQLPFDVAPVDPSSARPERYLAAFELLEDIWSQLRDFRPVCGQDEFLTELIDHLESQFVAAGLVLTIKVELVSGS